jgi:toxin ParE1/3/4
VAEIVWTKEAVRCLEGIHDYIAAQSAPAAHRMVSEIYAKIQRLRDHPRLGQRFERITDREVREIRYGHYRIAYLIRSEDRVEILGVFHGAMEIDRFFE